MKFRNPIANLARLFVVALPIFFWALPIVADVVNLECAASDPQSDQKFFYKIDLVTKQAWQTTDHEVAFSELISIRWDDQYLFFVSRPGRLAQGISSLIFDRKRSQALIGLLMTMEFDPEIRKSLKTISKAHDGTVGSILLDCTHKSSF